MRRLICLLLLVCLPLQSFALQSGALLYARAGDYSISHQVDHAEGVEHHHDDNGSVHYDDSAESVQHIQDHSWSSQPAFLSVPYQALPPQQSGSPVDDAVARFIPDPFVDSPLRPPASSLG